MTIRHGTWVSQAVAGVGVTSPLEARLALAAMLAKDTNGKARQGVFFDGITDLVAGTAGMAYSVTRFGLAQVRSAADGAVIVPNDGTVSVATTAAPASNSRIDRIYAWQRDFALDGTNSDPVIGVAQGNSAVSPVAPAIPTGAVELARFTVPAGITATTSAVGTQTVPFTAMAGGTVVARTKTELDGWSAPDGSFGYLIDTDATWQRLDGAWTRFAPRSGFDVDKTATPQSIGTGSGTGLTTWAPLELRDFTASGANFTCQRDGRYRALATVAFASAAGEKWAYLSKNGTGFGTLVPRSVAPAGSTAVSLAGSVRLDAGDTISLCALQASGANMNVIAANFSLEYVGP